MTVRPVDLQTLMPKSTEVSKIQHLQKENQEAQKAILTSGFQAQLETSRQKVNKRTRPEGIIINEEQEKPKGDSDRKSKKQSKNQDPKEQRTSIKKSGHYIDIKI